MSRDIVSDIVRNALEPDPVDEDGRPRETPLEERLRLLRNALGGTQQRVAEQQRKLETLRAELDEYRALMERVKQKAVAAQRAAELLPAPAATQAPAPEPAPAPAPGSATLPVRDIGYVTEICVSTAMPSPQDDFRSRAEMSVPLPAPHPNAARERPLGRPLEDAVVPRLRWRQFVPYVAIALFGAAMSALVARHPAQPSLKVASVPPPAPTAQAAAPAEEESNAEVLNLVSSYVPPGAKRSVADILGPEMDDPATESPWTIMRVDERTTLVSFRPYGDVIDGAPVYEFTVDPVAKSVTASAETLANLKGGAVTAAR